MAFLESPGVKISEVDLSTTIPTEGVSDAAFVGTGFTWGPVDTAVTVSSEKELVRIFGKPAKGNKDWFTAASFLAYGGDLQIIRQIGDDATKASGGSITVDSVTSSVLDSTQAGADDAYASELADVMGLGGSNATLILKITGVKDSDNSLEAGDIVIEDQLNLSDNTNIIVQDSSTKAVFSINGETNVVTVLHQGDRSYTVDDEIDVSNQLIDDVIYNTFTVAAAGAGGTLAGGSNAITIDSVSVDSSVIASNLKLYIDDGTDASYIIATVTESGTGMFTAKYEGSFGKSLRVVVEDQDADGDYIKVEISEITTNSSNEKVVVQVLESYDWLKSTVGTDDFGKNIYVNEVLNENSSYVDVSGVVSNDTYDLSTGGVDDDASSRDYSEFKDTEKYDVDLIVGGIATGEALECATARADCVAFVSATGLSSDNLETDITAAKSSLTPDSFGFMDSGSKKMYDKYNDGFVEGIPLNGDIAGLCVRTDNTREPWYSPAGFNRGQLRNVVSLTYDPSQSDRDGLYEANINPVSTFPGQGVVLFGDKTLQTKPSAFDRINVRRLFNIIEKTIKDVAKYSLFEFNDEFTRAQFRSIITPYLRDIQSRRGITDFLVVCDDSNNPANIIDSNQFIGDIFIKPSRSVNFIQLNFVAVSTGVSFNEVVGAV